LHEILTADDHLVRTALEPISQEPQPEIVSWQEAMRRAIRSAARLRELLDLPPADSEQSAQAERDFPTFVPLEYLRRIRPADLKDPLLLQVLPVAAEATTEPGFVSDPVGDRAALVSAGLLQKYAGRALVITTGVCGVHCRYCFRREFDYSLAHRDASEQPLSSAIAYLRQQPSIDEVILSGGDPLTLSDARFDRLLDAIESISHVRRLRIHSRMPIVIPQGVTERLAERLQASRLATWMVIHCNHPQEIDDAVDQAIARLIDHGIPVLNQAVLLAGVNDDVDVLAQLCRELVNRRVQPYYLHQLDRVVGAAHFEVPLQRGQEIISGLRALLPGYAVPAYVSEIEGETSKRPI
jgi:EF-P beta-lysylation protein EpmB